MVTIADRNRRGAGSLGCLLSLLVLVIALYYGVNIGEVYWRYYQLVDEMQVNARVAPGITDDVIQRRLDAKVGDIFGPGRRIPFRIIRGSRDFVVQAQYRDSVSLPLFKHTFVLRPRAEEPL
ncbi:MAG TPA: hypothetical protein VFW66_13185 [Gemmatimonadales bacterium]|nr:hypothetical protein [Gemmatimonadales bacterium]